MRLGPLIFSIAMVVSGQSIADHRAFSFYDSFRKDNLTLEQVVKCGDPSEVALVKMTASCQLAFETCEQRYHLPDDTDLAADADLRSWLTDCNRVDADRFVTLFLHAQDIRNSLITDPNTLALSKTDSMPVEVAGRVAQRCAWDTTPGDFLAFAKCTRTQWHTHVFNFGRIVMAERDAKK